MSAILAEQSYTFHSARLSANNLIAFLRKNRKIGRLRVSRREDRERSRLQASTIQSGMNCGERRLCMKVNINVVSLAYAASPVAGVRVSVSRARVFFRSNGASWAASACVRLFSVTRDISVRGATE